VDVNQESQFKEEIDMMILRNKRVLIVDDNQTNRQILSLQCNRMGMVPFVTGSPKEAIEWIGHGQGFDLVMLDMHMPEMDGFELGLAIREMRSNEFLPLMMLSSVGKKGKPENYPDDVFSVFLAKPVKQAQLKEKVTYIFGVPKKENKTAGNTIDTKLADRLPLQILLAEDNAINQKLAVLTFEKMGYRVDVANNGFEAVHAVQHKVYDLIFMDMQMPEMDGLEATRQIRVLFGENRPRIIAMTANAMKEDRDRCFEAGMDDFITKPILIKQIQSKLIEWGETMQPEKPHTTSAKQIIDAGHLTDIGITADFFKELADMYIDQSKTLITEIKSYAHTGELSGFRQIAHTLKGISANIGAVAMVDACQALEKVQAHHRPKEINVLLHQLGIVHEETCFHLGKSMLDEHFLSPEAAA
jgi:CheY-like chemotaxis protein/HPt (histidine-containing phosphotransfer) domain-containing protein